MSRCWAALSLTEERLYRLLARCDYVLVGVQNY